jgi:hypothetical protein
VCCIALVAVVHVEQHQVLIAVVDHSGHPAQDLRASDFTLDDAGVSCEITGVEPASYPLAIVLDTSSYARSDFRTLQTAVEEFVQTAPSREMAVYDSGLAPSLVQDFTRDRRRVGRAIAAAAAAPNGSTHTLEMIVRASTDLARHKSAIGAVLALSAGGIEMNPPNAPLALKQLSSNNTIVNVIEERSIRLDKGAAQVDQSYFLRILAERTHGRYFGGVGADVYRTGLADVMRQLDSEMILDYVAPQGAKGELNVQVKPPSSVVMAMRIQ